MYRLSKYIFYEITQILPLKDTIKLSGVCKRNHRIIRTKYGDKNIFMVKKDIDRTDLSIIYVSQTMLMTASSDCRIDVMKMLIEAGADVNKKTAANEASLEFALASDCKRSYRSVKILIDCGANIENRNFLGITPLSRAVDTGRSDIVELLINKGANVNVEYRLSHKTQLYTPLTMACSMENKKIVKMLLEAGADPHKITNHTLSYFTATDATSRQKKIGRMIQLYRIKYKKI